MLALAGVACIATTNAYKLSSLTMHLHRHLSDRRTGLLLRGATSDADEMIVRKAELCVGVISQARHLVATDAFDSPLGQLLLRAHELLDDIDERVLRLDHHNDRAVFIQLDVLRQGLAELEARRAAASRSAVTGD